jgi:uncharacterized protein with FMN-binding domain
MRRALAASLGAATIALPIANAAAAATERSTATLTTPKKTVVLKKVSGPAVNADRWGTVQINVTVKKTTTIVKGVKKVTRTITDIGGSYSYHTDRSQYIMSQSLPQLRQQALQSLSANVSIISGATYTSQAFIGSLQQALAMANKV